MAGYDSYVAATTGAASGGTCATTALQVQAALHQQQIVALQRQQQIATLQQHQQDVAARVTTLAQPVRGVCMMGGCWGA